MEGGTARWRLVALALALAGLLVLGHVTHARELATVERVRGAVERAGALGIVVFLLAFAAGELVHIPGLVFIAVAVLAWGRPAGGAIAYAGALVSLATSFVVVRSLAGQTAVAVERPWIKRALEWAFARPVLAIAALRVVFIVSPPLNYALALSRVRFRDYLAGSALGLVVPVTLAVVFFDALVRTLP